MTKSIFLATVMAVSLGAGAAMAEDGDARNPFNGSRGVFDAFTRGDFEIRVASPLSNTNHGIYPVRSHRLSIVPEAGDGDFR